MKAEQTIKRLRTKRRESTGMEKHLYTVGAPLAVGLLKARGTSLPTIGGFDSNLTWGLALALLGPRIGSGSFGRGLEAAGVGLLAVAASRAGETGTMRTEGEEDED